MAQVKLTQRFVNQCVANGKTQHYFDETLPSFFIKVMPKGAVSYHVRIQYQGERRSCHLGKVTEISIDDARQSAIDKQKSVHGERILELDFATYGERFFQSYSRHWKREKTVNINKSIFHNKLVPEFGHYKVNEIEPLMVKRWLSKQSIKNHTPLALLSVMMKHAQTYGYRSNDNPCKGLRKRNHAGRMRYLTQTELQRLWQALDTCVEMPVIMMAFRLLILTGCRISEIQLLRKDAHRHGHLYLTDSKTGAKTVYLSDAAIVRLEQARELSGESCLFFPLEVNGAKPIHYAMFNRVWKRLCRHAELTEFTIHDLRHSYASFALQSGEHLLTIGQLLGHTDPNTTLKYAHLATSHIHAAAEKVSSQLARGLSL